jgi:excisionase family DNA binding protein
MATSKTTIKPERWLTIPEVAEQLGIARTSVYDLIAAGELGEPLDVGSAKRPRTRIGQSAVDAFIERRRRSLPKRRRAA